MQDPTREEMLACINADGLGGCADEFAIEEAIYWFASDWHGGQGSNLYSVLSTSEFKPGAIATGPEDFYLYDLLVAEFNSAE